MKEATFIAVLERGLFIKFSLLALLVFGVVLATPAAHFAGDLAQQICQYAHSQGVDCLIS